MFDEPLFNTPRTWKYAVPGAIVVLLIPVIGRMLMSPNPETQYWSLVPMGFCILFAVVMLVNLWKYITAHNAEMFSLHQEALSLTPLVLLSQNMKQMHPEAVKVLNRFGVRTSWQVRVNTNLGTRDWVLADTNVHFGFIEFVLSRSGSALWAKRHFNEGSKKWDPDGLVEDREQYDEFETWLFARMMVTRSHGDFKPAEFIPPWTPKLLLETMGMSGEQDLYRPAEEPRKDLGKQEAVRSQVSGNGHKPEPVVDDDLTDADMEAIRAEMARNASQYRP